MTLYDGGFPPKADDDGPNDICGLPYTDDDEETMYDVGLKPNDEGVMTVGNVADIGDGDMR